MIEWHDMQLLAWVNAVTFSRIVKFSGNSSSLKVTASGGGFKPRPIIFRVKKTPRCTGDVLLWYENALSK